MASVDEIIQKPPFLKRLLFGLATTLLVTFLLEGCARLVYEYRHQITSALGIKPELDLDAYEIADSDHPGNWKLKPGYSETLVQAIKSGEAFGRVLRVQPLRERANLPAVEKDDVVLRINRDGFRGPELEVPQTGLRILSWEIHALSGADWPPIREYWKWS